MKLSLQTPQRGWGFFLVFFNATTHAQKQKGRTQLLCWARNKTSTFFAGTIRKGIILIKKGRRCRALSALYPATIDQRVSHPFILQKKEKVLRQAKLWRKNFYSANVSFFSPSCTDGRIGSSESHSVCLSNAVFGVTLSRASANCQTQALLGIRHRESTDTVMSVI